MKVGVVYLNVYISKHSKEELVCAIDQQYRVISIIMIFKILSYITKKLKNKVILK